MDVDFVRDRITQLRIQKGVSEYKMSYDLGHSRSYINNISSGKTLPSMAEFMAICDYFEITPMTFFDVENRNPIIKRETAILLEGLTEEDMAMVQCLVKRLQRTG